jgi:hypothetical protein
MGIKPIMINTVTRAHHDDVTNLPTGIALGFFDFPGSKTSAHQNGGGRPHAAHERMDQFDHPRRNVDGSDVGGVAAIDAGIREEHEYGQSFGQDLGEYERPALAQNVSKRNRAESQRSSDQVPWKAGL